MDIMRGSIYLAALDSAAGTEIVKTRYVLVVSNDLNNQYSNTVTILPLTSQNLHKTYPFEVYLSKGMGGLPKDSKVKGDQVRTINKARLVAFIGNLSGEDMLRIEQAMSIHLSLI